VLREQMSFFTVEVKRRGGLTLDKWGHFCILFDRISSK